MRKLFFLFVAAIIVIGAVLLFNEKALSPGWLNLGKNKSASQKREFNKSKYSIDVPSSLWVVVNKKRSLPSNYEPKNLVASANGEQIRADANGALSKLLADGKAAGIELRILSGYRSYAHQDSLFNSYVSQDGQSKAETYSARPGYSEHQTGLAADLGTGICDLEACFGDTAEGKWLAKIAHKYGFIVRYPKGKDNLTGYQYEPWHLRFVGKELAAELKKTGQTMEEFFGLAPAPNY